MDDLEKDLNVEIKYYLKSIGKELLDRGDSFNISKYDEPSDVEDSDLVELIEYVCYLIAINGDYRKNPIHFFIKDMKSENHWQKQIWKVMENTAQKFVLRFARLRRARLHKDIVGNSFGDVKDSKVHISRKI